MKVKDWLDTIERNTPTNYPNLSCGWPDDMHGISHEFYRDEALGAVEGTEDGADIPQFPTFENWKQDRRDEAPDRDDLGFSWDDCDLCGGLAGDRHAVTALPDNPAENHDYVALSVCNSCLMYIANGDVPDWLEDD